MMRRRSLIAAIATGAMIAALCAGCASHDVRVSASPARAAVDVPTTVTVTGVQPGATVRIDASAVDPDDVRWRSSADFVASANGSVSTADASVGGSYRGRDRMGLLSLMTHPGAPSDTTFRLGGKDITVHLAVDTGGTEVAHTDLVRSVPSSLGVTRTTLSLAHGGVLGVRYDPASSAKRPGVLVIGGSEGGLSRILDAELLAADGYPALDVAYFHAPGLPTDLKDIPLETFARAAAALRQDPRVDPSRIVLWGVSRGSEAALLTAADLPGVADAVIAGSPNAIAYPAYPVSGNAWTLHGSPVTAYSALPVDRIRVPVLTICGGADLVWNSCGNASTIADTRRADHLDAHDTALSYPAAGHLVGEAIRYVSTTTTSIPTVTGTDQALGGTVQANATASADARDGVLAFLDHLGR